MKKLKLAAISLGIVAINVLAAYAIVAFCPLGEQGSVQAEETCYCRDDIEETNPIECSAAADICGCICEDDPMGVNVMSCDEAPAYCLAESGCGWLIYKKE